jgi:hypothetical protein
MLEVATASEELVVAVNEDVEFAGKRVTVLVTALPNAEPVADDVGPAPALFGPPAIPVVVAAVPLQLGKTEGEYVAVPL